MVLSPARSSNTALLVPQPPPQPRYGAEIRVRARGFVPKAAGAARGCGHALASRSARRRAADGPWARGAGTSGHAAGGAQLLRPLLG